MTEKERREAADWFHNRYCSTNMPGAAKMFRRAEEALREGLDDEPETPETFEPGELFIYVNGDRYELGKVKRPNNNGTGYFCYYHSGNTASNTPTEHMHKLTNSYVVGRTTLGGSMT